MNREQIERIQSKIPLLKGVIQDGFSTIHSEQLWNLCDIALKSLDPALGWQPISTAPKDGSHMLMYRGVHIDEAWWRLDVFGKAYEWGGAGWSYPEWDQPTHWQPLPPLPR